MTPSFVVSPVDTVPGSFMLEKIIHIDPKTPLFVSGMAVKASEIEPIISALKNFQLKLAAASNKNEFELLRQQLIAEERYEDVLALDRERRLK